MNCFSINVTVNGLRFKRYIPGDRNNYTDEQMIKLREYCKKEIKDKLDALGYVN